MSYSTWHDYGYGVCVSDIKAVSVERLQALIHLAPKYERDIQTWLAECEISEPSVDDYLEFDQDYMLGLATMLKEVIEEAEGIRFTACEDCCDKRYLFYEPSYPWHLPEKEKPLTEENIAEILCKYVSILTDEEIPIDYDSAENGG